MNKLAKETTTKNRWTTKASDRKPHPESSVIEYSSKERNQRTDSNKTEGKNETPKQTALPEWLASDGLASLGEIDKLLSRDSSVLNKGVYKLILGKLRDVLYWRQNEEAVTRSTVAGIQKANRQMEDLVALKKALLSQLMETEKKDRKYIDLQLKEIGQIDREQLAVNAQQAEFMKGLSESQNVEGLLQHRLEAFEKAFAKKQVKTLDAVNAKEKQMLELLGDIKRLASSAQYSQERLISNLLKYKENKDRFTTKETIMETLETHIKIQDLRIKVHMLSGEIEALKADQDFEYWDEKEHIINNCLVHQRSKQQEAVEPAVAEKKPGFESLYTNQSPLFDFLSASSEPRHFYVEHKEVVNPADIIDPFCIRHNEHFKDKFIKKKASLKEGNLHNPSRPLSGAQTGTNTHSHVKERISSIMGEVNRSIQAHGISKQRRTNLKR